VSDWRRSFPGSLYLDLGKDTSEPLLMRIYGASRWQGLSGRKTADARHKPKQEIFTVAEGDEALAFTAGEIAAARRVDTALSGKPLSIRWDAALEVPRADGPDGQERAVVPMLWFAADRHYARVRTLFDPAH
jgi:hypothetical protein